METFHFVLHHIKYFNMHLV